MAAEQVVPVGRIYAPAGAGEGARLLVDRLWPRGGEQAGCGAGAGTTRRGGYWWLVVVGRM